MATTNFVTDVTVIEADWLNDADAVVYDSYYIEPTVPDVDAAIATALASGKKKIIFAPGGAFTISATIAIGAGHYGVKFEMTGATINKSFNGDLFTITDITRIEFNGGRIDGQYGTYTGKCFVVSGVTDLFSCCNIETVGFTDSHYEFGVDAGKRASIIGCTGLTSSGQGTLGRMVHFAGLDTLSIQRKFSNCSFDGYVDSDGAHATFFSNCSVTYCTTNSTTTIFSFAGGMWGNSGLAASVDGDNINISGVRLAAAVTLESGSNGSFVGNVFTSGGLTDSSGSGAWFLTYKASGATDYTFGQSLLNFSASVPERIQTSRTVSAGDAAITFNPATSAPVIWYGTTITADRTVALSTTSATNGTRLRVTRPASGAFNVNIGTGPIKALAAGEWCDVEYNGSAYILTAFGAL